jgi:hypothetical protein
MSAATSGFHLLELHSCGLLAAVKALGGLQDEAAAPTCHATALTILAAAIALPAPARAQTYDPSYPVCLQVYQSIVDYYYECRLPDDGAVRASASGRSAQCVVNPYYGGPNAGAASKSGLSNIDDRSI